MQGQEKIEPTRRLMWLWRFNKRITNRLTRAVAGRRVYALIYHVGRKSGTRFTTPVVAMPTGDGFVIPLPYGADVDWCKNILAAGGALVQAHGQMYTVCAPCLVEPSAAVPFFPRWLHPLLGHTKIYLRVDARGAKI